MLTRRIIPCLDVKDGRVVKGVRFVALRDAGDPVEVAAAYDAGGADELCFLDISASPEGRGTLLEMVSRVADAIRVPFSVGGGVRTVDDFLALLGAGADKVCINTAAVDDPSLIEAAARRAGNQAVVAAVDARKLDADAPPLAPRQEPPWLEASPGLRVEDGGFEVYTHGGRIPTGLDAVRWCERLASLGAGEILLTSMDRDGTHDGFDLELTRAVSEAISIPVIASGGVGELEHFAQGLEQGAADAVLAASVFHFGELTIAQVKAHLASRGLPVRQPGIGFQPEVLLTAVKFDERGLVPVVAQSVLSKDVLMLAWADAEALTATVRTGLAHYHSRSRDELWQKGATSGNVQAVESIRIDCDGDTVLYLVREAGPACHLGTPTCFSGVPREDG